MAVAALSTSALALAAGPVPAAPGAAQAPGAFAKLVVQAKPDGKPSQDGAAAGGSTDGRAEAALDGEEAALVTTDAATTVPAPVSPADLLARLDAMLAAAGQIGVSQPATLTPTATGTTTTTPEATTATAAMPAPILVAAAVPAPATTNALAPQAAPMAATVAVAAPNPSVAPTDEALPAATPASAGEKVVATPGASADTPPIVRPAVLQRGSDIAQLLASLRTAFGAVGDGAAPAPAPALAVAAQSIPIVPASAEPVLPQPAVAAAPIADTDAPVLLPGAITPPAVQPDPTAPAVTPPVAPEAVSTAPAAPKADEPAIRASLPDPAIVTAEAPATAPAPEADTPADSVEVPAPTVTAEAPAPLPTPAPVAPLAVAPEATDGIDGAAPAASQIDQSVARELDLVRDHQWLDRLARDISQAATKDGHIRFQLNPEHLGALTVEIANSAAGTAIRLTAETDQARAIIADAQPRLLAEVRAQGLRVAESHVDSNQQGQGGSASAQPQQQQHRQSSEDSKPFVRTQTAMRDDAGDSAPDNDGELYA